MCINAASQPTITIGQDPTGEDEEITCKCHAFVIKNLLHEKPDFPFSEKSIRDALICYRDEEGERIANNRVRVHFRFPRPCEKWACLLTMEPIDKPDKPKKEGVLSKLKFW